MANTGRSHVRQESLAAVQAKRSEAGMPKGGRGSSRTKVEFSDIQYRGPDAAKLREWVESDPTILEDLAESRAALLRGDRRFTLEDLEAEDRGASRQTHE